jgi:hypothetical protein
MWEVEPIPDADAVFYRVHSGDLLDGKLHPGVFRERNGGMSSDWEKYSTADASRLRARHPGRTGIVTLNVGPLRELTLQVIHAPDYARDNRSHANISGMSAQKLRIRTELYRRFGSWTLRPQE